MKSFLRIAFAAVSFGLALGACQGSFGSGGTAEPGGMNPPVNGPAQGQMNPQNAAQMTPAPMPTSSPVESDAYSFAQADQGLKCPDLDGYSCTLYFNMSDEQLAAVDASPSPSPKPGKHSKKATPTPSPTPTPTPTPTPDASGSPSASPSASPAATNAKMKIALATSPQDAPSMANADSKAPPTVALVSLRLTTTDDVTIQNNASARFTLPQDQITKGRGFAIQLFRETLDKKKKRNDSFVGSYKESKLDSDTLIFTLKAPKLAVKKGETWLLVLYGDRLASPSPLPMGAPVPEYGAPQGGAVPPDTAPQGAPPEGAPPQSDIPPPDTLPSQQPTAAASPTP